MCRHWPQRHRQNLVDVQQDVDVLDDPPGQVVVVLDAAVVAGLVETTPVTVDNNYPGPAALLVFVVAKGQALVGPEVELGAQLAQQIRPEVKE